MCSTQAAAGFPARLREVAQRIAKEDGPSQMGLGAWLELHDAVQHSGRVLFRANPEAAEFAEKYAPKLDGDAGVDIYITQDHTLLPGDYYSIASGVCILSASSCYWDDWDACRNTLKLLSIGWCKSAVTISPSTPAPSARPTPTPCCAPCPERADNPLR